MRLAAKLADRRMKTFWRRVCTFSFHHTVNTAKSSLRCDECLLSPWVVLAGISSLYKLHTVAAGLGWGRGCGPASWPSSPHRCSSSFSILVFCAIFFTFSAPSYSSSLHRHLPWSYTLLPIVPPAPLFLSQRFVSFLIFLIIYIWLLWVLGATSELCFLKKKNNKTLILTQCCKSAMY